MASVGQLLKDHLSLWKSGVEDDIHTRISHRGGIDNRILWMVFDIHFSIPYPFEKS